MYFYFRYVIILAMCGSFIQSDRFFMVFFIIFLFLFYPVYVNMCNSLFLLYIYYPRMV